MPVIRNCKQCGDHFAASPSKKTEHCSDKCSRKTQAEVRTKPLINTLCKMCGAGFQYKTKGARKKLYCSDVCLFKFRQKPPGNKQPYEYRNCEQCRESFEAQVSSARRFCGQRCANTFRQGKPLYHLRNRITLQCDFCSSVFEVTPARATARYCCHRCASDARTLVTGTEHPLFKEKIKCQCEWCGKEFDRPECHVRKGNVRFCSQSCQGASSSYQQQGRRSSIELAVEQVLIALNIPFEVQKPIGPWIVDFYLPEKNLVIECDGDYWHSLPDVQSRDRRKDYYLNKQGYEVVRLKEHAIKFSAFHSVQQVLQSHMVS